MKLFLTSSTITSNLLPAFEGLVGRSLRGLQVAFIPDAGYGSSGEGADWIAEERQELTDNFDWEVTEVKLQNESPETITKLADFDVIYVNGGFSGYLAKVMRNSGFTDILPQLLQRGVVYVGSSAGGMVLSDTQDAASWYIGEPEPEAKDIPGLGLIDFQIYPMHDSRFSPDLVDQIQRLRNPKLKYFLLRDGHAISVEDGLVKIHGDGVVFLDIINHA